MKVDIFPQKDPKKILKIMHPMHNGHAFHEILALDKKDTYRKLSYIH